MDRSRTGFGRAVCIAVALPSGFQSFLFPNGPSLCISLDIRGSGRMEGGGAIGCAPVGTVQDVDVTQTFPLERGDVSLIAWAQACICGDEAALPQSVRIDALLRGVTVE